MLFLIILITFLLAFTNNVFSCWGPTDLSHRIQAPCPEINLNWKREPATLVTTTANNSDMFTVSLNCLVDKPEICQKVQKAFDMAGEIISSEIKFKTPVRVNATYVDFCQFGGLCSNGTGQITLGGAGPARLIPMGEEQIVYPQSLLKQLVDADLMDSLLGYDITALFNSQGDYWFNGDSPIGPSQSDFLFVILHELTHGLGFASGWSDHIELLGVPNIITPTPIFLTTSTGKVIFGGFREFILDKFMVVLSDGTRVSDFAVEINKFSGVGTNYSSLNDFITHFQTTFPSSPQYKIAQKMMTLATTPKSLGLLALNKTNVKDALILETSLVPFLPKSSISHCDYKTYSKDPDFLMRYLEDPGITLKDNIRLGGNYRNGPIGPKLSQTLSLMGYQIQELPNQFQPDAFEQVKSASVAPSLKTFNPNYIIVTSLFTLVIHRLFYEIF